MVSHRAASLGIQYLELNDCKRWLLFFNPAFSAAQRLLLATLGNGGCLCLAKRERLATALPDVMRNLQVDGVGMTPSALSTTITPDELPSSVKQIFTVGEPLSQKVSDAWAEKVRLEVTYALSECPMLNFSRELQKGDDPRIPGKPHGATEAVVLDPETLERVPIGQPGELCFYGSQLANGYHRRPSQMENKFISNPIGPGTLLRSGDQAVQLLDGSFQIQGRLDSQVKIAGHRVEPEEIANTLLTVVNVRAIICTGATINDKTSLVAVVIPPRDIDQGNGRGWSTLVDEMRAQAMRLFPSYMVPTYWLRCEGFPKSHNGKTDLKAVRALVESTDISELLGRDLTSGLDEGRRGAFTEVGAEISHVWAGALRLDSSIIRPSDSFIALGGGSLDAIGVIQELRGHDIHIQLADIMQGQTVEEVAKLSQLHQMQKKTFLPGNATGRFPMLADQTLAEELAMDSDVVDAFPPTALQEGILASTMQGNLDYLYQRVFHIDHLDLVRLRLAFEVVFLRSQLLQSTFVTGTRGFAQVIRSDFSLPWIEDPSLSLMEYLTEDKEDGVTFGEPFFRIAVVEENSTLVVSVHHALFDYWSHGFIFEDVAQLYSGQRPVMRPSWRQFIEIAQDRASDETAQEFWVEYLADAAPTILNHAPTQVSYSAHRSIPLLPKATLAQLQIPSSAVLYGAWALVLSSHTASETVSMAVAVSGRELPLQGIENLDGPTLATVPQVVDVRRDISAAEVVQGLNSNMWNVTRYSQYGIRGALAAAGHQNIELFDTMVNIHIRPEQKGKGLVRRVLPLAGPQEPWKTEHTTLNLEEGPDGISVQLTGQMEPRRVEFIVDQFCRAVETIISNAATKVKDICLMTREELDFVHRPVQKVEAGKTLLGEFESAVSQYPDRIAVNCMEQEKEMLTYSKLNSKATTLGLYLSFQGVRSGDIVPVLLDKSPLMILTILALFKVGAAYVALDPENPLERNAFIAQEIGAQVVVTEAKHASYFASQSAPTLRSILVDDGDLERAGDQFGNGSTMKGVSPSSLAYIVYTSGSTGQPKGVAVSHGACATAISSLIDFEEKRGQEFRSLQFSNYIFDASVYDFFLTLHSGGTLCVASGEQLLDDLVGVINLMQVTHIFMTPTVARILDPKEVPCLRSATIGGEQVMNDVVDRWGRALHLRLAYGPTETSVMVSLKNVEPGITQGSNIGTLMPSVGAVILEPNGDRPVPYGGLGELCLMGPQLANGYFNRLDLTSGAFSHLPDVAGGQRLYRSGDLARYLPGGEIECLGRKDHQVKINGHRIELGEIESAMLGTGFVKDCIVVVWKQNSTSHLVALPVFNTSAGSNKKGEGVIAAGTFLPMEQVAEEAENVKKNLGNLAHYMMPNFVIPISSFPLLPSGKADRKKIRARVQAMKQAELSRYSFGKIGNADSEIEVIPPTTNEQKVLRQAWMEILDLSDSNFGLEANFLSLGGDSISAINLVSYLRRKGLVISVRDVQKNPFLGAMSERLVHEEKGANALSKPAEEFHAPGELSELISAAGLNQSSQVQDIYPCPPGQSEFLTQGARPESYWCLMAIRPLGYSQQRAEKWVELTGQLTRTNSILRSTFTRCQGKWYGVVLRDAEPVVDYHSFSTAEERDSIILSIWNHKFTFGGSFIRYAILHDLSSGKYEVLTKMDHGLYDGTLLRVFGAHFQSYQRGEEPRDFTTYEEFASHIWQINQTQKTLDFWTGPDKRPTRFQYPGQKHPQTRAAMFRTIHLNFDEFTRSSGVTVAIMFQTVFQMWLSLRSGESDVAFDYLTTGRNVDLADPQSINGACANFLPMRYKVDGDMTASELLERTSDEFWQYTENGTVGLEDIFRACDATREEFSNQILFLFQPFEPAPVMAKGDWNKPAAESEMALEWVVLPKSQIKIPQPYAVVCEVKKTADENGYKLSFTYDDRVWTSAQMEEEMGVIEGMLGRLMQQPHAAVRDIIRG